MTYLKPFESLHSGYECPHLIHASAETVLKNSYLSRLNGCVSQPSHAYWIRNPKRITDVMLKKTYVAHFRRLRPGFKALWTRCSNNLLITLSKWPLINILCCGHFVFFITKVNGRPPISFLVKWTMNWGRLEILSKWRYLTDFQESARAGTPESGAMTAAFSPCRFKREATGRRCFFNNSIMGNFMVHQDRLAAIRVPWKFRMVFCKFCYYLRSTSLLTFFCFL